MAHQFAHINLTAQGFPINFKEFTSGVFFASQAEQNRYNLSGSDLGNDSQGVCQATYLDNVMPIYRGYSSVDYDNLIPSLYVDGELVHVERGAYVQVQASSGRIYYLVINSFGLFVYRGVWKKLEVVGSSIRTFVVNVRGKTYLYLPLSGFYVYNENTNALELQPTKGIDFTTTNFVGATAIAGRVVLYTDDTIVYSSYTDVLDFRPEYTDNNNVSHTTGAGSAQILGVQGEIKKVLPLGGNLIVYTDRNAVAGQQTGNSQLPWKFQAIPGFPGIASIAHVAGSTGTQQHFAYTKSGMFSVTLSKCAPLFSELSEAIAKGISVSVGSSGYPRLQKYGGVRIAVNLIAERYVVISYGSSDDEFFETAYVYDLSIQRWGRLSVPHIDVVDFDVGGLTGAYTFANFVGNWIYQPSTAQGEFKDLGHAGNLSGDYSIFSELVGAGTFGQVTKADLLSGDNFIPIKLGLIRADGTFVAVKESTEYSVQQNGVLMLGRFKFSRSSGDCLQFVMCEGLNDADVSAYAHGYSGEIVRMKRNLLPHRASNNKRYGRIVGDGISVTISGNFALTDMTIAASKSGRKNLQNPVRRSPIVVNGNPIYTVNNTDSPIVAGASYE